MDLHQTDISILPLLRCYNNLIAVGTATISNMYNKNGVYNLLNAKQDNLIDRGGEGSVLIDGSNKVSRIFGVNGINVNRYLNLSGTNDPKKINIQVDATGLQSSINLNSASTNNLSSAVSVNSLDISASDLFMSTMFFTEIY